MSRYIVITPVRNEMAHIGATIESMAKQIVRPALWIIVNDGSTDQTASIIDAASAQHPWIKAVHRPDRGFRKSGGGVIEAFNDGLSLLARCETEGRVSSWDFIVKLDGDLKFGPDFFSQCFDKFISDPKLGIGGGVICKEQGGHWVEESAGDPLFHVRGATKIYKRECWDRLGGLVVAPGWDTLDELKANMLGWRTYTFREIQLLQLKSTGTADGTWKNWVKNGLANYITGYHPVFMLAKCAKRSLQKPYVVAALGLLSGFVGGYLKRVPQVRDSALIGYVRAQQINRLLGRQSLWS